MHWPQDGGGLGSALRWAALVAVAVIIVLAVGLLIVGPASNLYPTGPLQCLSSPNPGGKAFVRNSELSEEFEILQASGVFDIVPEGQASKFVELQPMEMGGACGTPLVLTWATNGLVPATVRVNATFSFTVEENGAVSEQKFVLEGERRVSLVQRLIKPFLSDRQTWGAILASEYERGR